MAAPPSEAGAVQVTVAWPSPAVATTLVGASGATEATAAVAVAARPPPTSAVTRTPARQRWRQSPGVFLLLPRLLLMSMSVRLPACSTTLSASPRLDARDTQATRLRCCRPGSTVWLSRGPRPCVIVLGGSVPAQGGLRVA